MLSGFPGRGIDRFLRDHEVYRWVVRMKKSIEVDSDWFPIPHFFKLASSGAQLRRFALKFVSSPHVSRGCAVQLESIKVLGK